MNANTIRNIRGPALWIGVPFVFGIILAYVLPRFVPILKQMPVNIFWALPGVFALIACARRIGQQNTKGAGGYFLAGVFLMTMAGFLTAPQTKIEGWIGAVIGLVVAILIMIGQIVLLRRAQTRTATVNQEEGHEAEGQTQTTRNDTARLDVNFTGDVDGESVSADLPVTQFLRQLGHQAGAQAIQTISDNRRSQLEVAQFMANLAMKAGMNERAAFIIACKALGQTPPAEFLTEEQPKQEGTGRKDRFHIHSNPNGSSVRWHGGRGKKTRRQSNDRES